MSESLTPAERKYLLKLARTSMEQAVRGQPLTSLDPSEWSNSLREEGASFVTLTLVHSGALRGCVGALEAYQPLAFDVREHAIAAALKDYRFPPVAEHELHSIQVEISRLTQPVPLEYDSPEDLLNKLTVGRDGVLLQDGWKRATFLPQVWEKVNSKQEFLDNLCRKMGVVGDHWRRKHLQISLYQVEEFHE
ncbi:AmmeMemoRadiSam system protein A [Chloroflexota bacterium]